MESTAEPLKTGSGRSKELPSASILIVAIEFWERFSYYGLMAILILFLTAASAEGGFGWRLPAALTLIGIFTGCAWTSPVVGGALADRWLGSRRAVSWGAVLLTLGNICLMLAVTAPDLLGFVTHEPLEQLLRGLGRPRGLLFPPADISARLHAVGVPSWLSFAYGSQALFFETGLGLIVLGNALLKSTLPVLLGEVFDAHGGRSDAAYSYYYMSITLGGLAALLLSGFLIREFGWAAGFACSALGMVFALSLYVGVGRILLRDVGLTPRRRSLEGRLSRLTLNRESWKVYKQGLIRIAIYGAFLIVYSIGWFQSQGLWLYEIDANVDRHLFGFTVPAQWVSAFYQLLLSLLSPVYAALSMRLAERNLEPPYARRFIAGFLLMALAHGSMALGFFGTGRQVPMAWSIAAIAAMSVSEILVWPASYGMVQRLAPPQLRSALMGAWIAMLGLGQYIAHTIAAVAERVGFFSFSAGVALLMIAAAVCLFFVDLGLSRFNNPKERSREQFNLNADCRLQVPARPSRSKS